MSEQPQRPVAANDNRPIAQVQALRSDLAGLSAAQIDERLARIEHALKPTHTSHLSVNEVAAVLGEKPTTVYRAINDGRLPARRETYSNQLRVAVTDAKQWADRPRRAKPGHRAFVETGGMPLKRVGPGDIVS